MKVWIDADACPKEVKEIIFKASEKQGFFVVLVANQHMAIPKSKLVRLEVVEKIFDEADNFIIDHAEAGDIAITADIPLASQLVDKSVVVINPRGKIYTPENVKEALSMRNMMEEFRGGGTVQGGPPPYGAKDKQNFANAFQKELVRGLNRKKSSV